MGTHYGQLSLTERISIGLLRAEGQSISKISAKLGRSKSTVSRELRRNSKPTKQWSGGYSAERAHGLTERRRRWDKRFKLARQPALRDHVRQRLAMGWSPDQLAAHLHDFINAYNYGRRLKTLRGVTPYEYICKCWTNEPERFSLNPHHQMPGPNI